MFRYCRVKSAACRRNRAAWYSIVSRFGVLVDSFASRSHFAANVNFTFASLASDSFLFMASLAVFFAYGRSFNR
jgi:hypothetical protein